MENYITLTEASNIWGISERRIRTLCAEGRIEGVTRFGRSWAIPEGTEKPADNRIKSENISKRKMALLPEVVFYTVIFLVDGRYDKR